MSNEQTKFITVILPMPAAEFDDYLNRWREENKAILEGIDATSFVVDTIRSKDGTTHRRLRMNLGQCR